MRSGWAAVALASWIAALPTVVAVAQPSICTGGVQANFSFTGGLQSWTVPSGVVQLEIRALGAGAGFSAGPDPPGEPLPIAIDGGVGAPIRASFPVTPNEVLTILVGGRGGDVTEASATGGSGGGSFVYRTADLAGLLIAAGGGASGFGPDAPSKNGSATTTASAGSGTGPGAAGAGATAGPGAATPEAARVAAVC